MLRQTPDNVSLLPQNKRDGSDFSTAYVPQGITTAKVTLFLSIEKPLNRGMVLSLLVLFYVDLHVLPASSSSSSYLQEQDWTDILG